MRITDAEFAKIVSALPDAAKSKIRAEQTAAEVKTCESDLRSVRSHSPRLARPHGPSEASSRGWGFVAVMVGLGLLWSYGLGMPWWVLLIGLFL